MQIPNYSKESKLIFHAAYLIRNLPLPTILKCRISSASNGLSCTVYEGGFLLKLKCDHTWKRSWNYFMSSAKPMLYISINEQLSMMGIDPYQRKVSLVENFRQSSWRVMSCWKVKQVFFQVYMICNNLYIFRFNKIIFHRDYYSENIKSK